MSFIYMGKILTVAHMSYSLISLKWVRGVVRGLLQVLSTGILRVWTMVHRPPTLNPIIHQWTLVCELLLYGSPNRL